MCKPELKVSWPRRLAREQDSLKNAVEKILKDTDEHDRQWALEQFIDERMKRIETRSQPDSGEMANG